MKAQELRIGSWVFDEGDINTPIQIVCIMNGNTDWLKPIPLTEDWLIKFGFKKQIKKTTGVVNYKLGKCIISNNRFYIPKYNDGHNYVDVDLLNHVHEQQNLYFALTGEELTIES